MEEVRLVAREPSARRAISVLRVECLRPRTGPTAKSTLVFTAQVSYHSFGNVITTVNECRCDDVAHGVIVKTPSQIAALHWNVKLFMFEFSESSPTFLFSIVSSTVDLYVPSSCVRFTFEVPWRCAGAPRFTPWQQLRHFASGTGDLCHSTGRHSTRRIA